MAKIKRTNVDSIRQAPIKKASYEAPTVKTTAKKEGVPKEYQTFKKAPKRRGGFIFFLFLVLIAAIIGWYYWNNQPSQMADKSLSLVVKGPQQVVSGDEVTYTVEYKNLDQVAMTEMELSVFWPEGFYFDQASTPPASDNAKTWLLADLAPGETGWLEIKGQLVGKKDEELKAIFTLDYQPSNFHSDFQEKQVIDTKVTDNKLDLTITAPAKVLVNTEQEIKVVYKNLTAEKISGLYLDVIYPEDWKVASVEPDKTEQYWIADLEPNEEKTITIKGNFNIESKLNQSVVAEIGNLNNEDFRRLSRTKHDIMVINPQFSVDLKVNGNSGDQAANWGDTLRYQLEITNDSEGEVADVQISALLSGGLIDWDSLETVGKKVDDKIVWTSDEDKELSLWPSKATKVFTWEVKLTDDPQEERLIENIVQINIAGLEDWEQVVSLSDLMVGESLNFNNGVYWNLGGRRVGQGLLPPQVNEETSYLVVWSIPSTTGEFESVKVETILPPHVDFANEAENSEGNLEYDESTRTVTWTLAGFADLPLPVSASFMINITPSAEDRGQAVTLLNTTSATAEGLEDVVVRSNIIKTSDVVADTTEPIGIVE